MTAHVFAFAPISDGVESVRMNALLGEEIPTVDLLAIQAVVPSRFAGLLVLASADKISIVH